MRSQRLTDCHYLDTGQRSCHADDGRALACEGSGQDGECRIGASWPEPHFEIVCAGVLDRLTH